MPLPFVLKTPARTSFSLWAAVALAAAARAPDPAVGSFAPAGGGAFLDCNENGVPDTEDLLPAFRLEASAGLGAGRNPCFVAAADLDGSGLPDVAAASEGSNEVLVILNRGRRSFEAAVKYPAGKAPHAIAAADLDSDGDRDLCVAWRGILPDPGGISILENHGDGSFEAAVDLPCGVEPWFVAAVDFDSDGAPDLAVADRASSAVLVLWNAGGGSFGEPIVLPAGRGTMALVAADFDGDGDPDIAAMNEIAGTVSISENLGARVFGEPASIAAGWLPAALAPGDLDGDGDLDLAVANRGSEDLALLRNVGSGSFAAGGTLALPGPPASAAVGDMDGDSDVDILVYLGGSGPVLLLEGSGKGAFLAPKAVAATAGAEGLALADLDGDALADLAASSKSTGAVTVTWNDRAGWLALARLDLQWSVTRVAAVRRSGGGAADLVVPRSTPFTTSLLRNDGTGAFIEEDIGLPGHAAAGADLDGDGDEDLAVGHKPPPWSPGTPPSVRILLNSGGTLTESSRVNLSGSALEIVPADLDGDARGDLAVLGSEWIGLAWNDGAGFGLEELGLTLAHDVRSIVAADLDLDGDLDLAGAGEQGISIFTNGGGRGFSEAPPFPPEGLRSIAAADLDGDGEDDLAVAGPSLSEVFVLPGVGDGRFGDTRVIFTGTAPYHLGAGDLDGDGRPDLAVADAGAASVVVLLNRGGFEFSPVCHAVDGWPGWVTIAELDGHVGLDLAAVTWDQWEDGLVSGEAALWILRNGTLPPASLDCNLNGVPDSCDLAGGTSADENGDGIPDECAPRFHRGDPGDDGLADISDAVFILGYLFLGTSAPECKESADANNDGRIDVSDPLHLLNWLFLGGPPPAAPGPPGSGLEGAPCGTDPDPAGSPADLGCERYSHCW